MIFMFLHYSSNVFSQIGLVGSVNTAMSPKLKHVKVNV
jgi:hypothetical protein